MTTTTKETLLEVAIRSELLSLGALSKKSARDRRNHWRKLSTVATEKSAETVPTETSENKEKELHELREHLESMWSTKEHPKKDELWNIANDLSRHDNLADVKEIYCRLIPLIIQ